MHIYIYSVILCTYCRILRKLYYPSVSCDPAIFDSFHVCLHAFNYRADSMEVSKPCGLVLFLLYVLINTTNGDDLDVTSEGELRQQCNLCKILILLRQGALFR